MPSPTASESSFDVTVELIKKAWHLGLGAILSKAHEQTEG